MKFKTIRCSNLSEQTYAYGNACMCSRTDKIRKRDEWESKKEKIEQERGTRERVKNKLGSWFLQLMANKEEYNGSSEQRFQSTEHHLEYWLQRNDSNENGIFSWIENIKILGVYCVLLHATCPLFDSAYAFMSSLHMQQCAANRTMQCS